MQLKPGTEQEYAKYRETNRADAYSARVVSYGEYWAALMEAEIERGKTVAQIAQETSHQADTDGITGFMYGAAVSALAHFWVHGEELRRWHNKDVQIGNEGDRANESGDVLNPAILTIRQ